MAGWDQVPGGQPLSRDDADEFLLDESESFLLTGDDEGGWLALSLAKTASVGEWLQANDWEASLIEEQPGAGGWEQSATWDATGLHAEPVAAEGTFEQTATWDAEALHAESQPVTAEGTWEQSATWEASVTHTEEIPEPPPGISIRRGGLAAPQPRPVVRMTASFGQTATWHATLDVDRTPVEFEELLLAGVL
jgi:hypothetical protein